VREYDSIFDKAFKEMISQTKEEDLWARWTGVATPRGEIWLNGIDDRRQPGKYEIKLTAINGVINRGKKRASNTR